MDYNEPIHPGKVLLEDFIKPNGFTLTQASLMLGISRKNMSNLVNERIALSPLMAHRIAKATNTTMEVWLTLQNKRDIYNQNKIDLDDVKTGCLVDKRSEEKKS